MTGTKQMLFAKNLICVCIEDDQNADFQGIMYHQYADEPIRFDSITEFVKIADELFDEWDFPQRGLAQRFFKDNPKKEIGYPPRDPGEKLPIDIIREKCGVRNVQNKRGKLGTFTVQVVFRQDATWQGHVIHLENNSQMDFESAMEMIRFMDAALSVR